MTTHLTNWGKMSFQRKPKQTAAAGGASGGGGSPNSSRSPKLTRMSVPGSGSGSGCGRSTQSAVAPGQLVAAGAESAGAGTHKPGCAGAAGSTHLKTHMNCNSMAAGEVGKEGKNKGLSLVGKINQIY